MKKNIKIITVVGLAFIISIGILFSFLEMYENGLITKEQIHQIESTNDDQIFLNNDKCIDKVYCL